MHREHITQLINNYRPETEEEEFEKVKTFNFVKENTECFENWFPLGHVTGTCWLENHDRSKFLLTKHKKLKLWLPLGGHSDGSNDIIGTSIREAHEESGLKHIELVSECIFDIGVHNIPEYMGTPSHYHYDIVFLLRAYNENEQIQITDESDDLKWFSEIPTDNETTLPRLFAKWKKQAYYKTL